VAGALPLSAEGPIEKMEIMFIVFLLVVGGLGFVEYLKNIAKISKKIYEKLFNFLVGVLFSPWF